ncbi:MAG: iron-sulfur cluster assembly protein [Desulfurococcus sp.]|nr:iron-sulfur cluster assembly protein [Desulfurococcus sp.]
MSDDLKKKVIEVLETIADPEIGIDVYNLGLVYNIEVVNEKNVKITMTLTTMFCPLATTLPLMIIDALKEKLGVDADINLVYEPPWTPLMMTEKGREMFKERFGYDIVEEYEKSMQESRE